VNHVVAETLCAMQRNWRGTGLLQCLVGEQPAFAARQVCEFRGSASAQQNRLHQNRCSAAVLLSQRGDLADSVGQRTGVDCGQRSGAPVRRQVRDVAEAELQDGLIPVIITL
jgi:hypothetical protein